MKLIYTGKELIKFREHLDDIKKSVGLVPTMGALHKGHLSLVEEAERQVDSVIVSIFVNPTQFNNPEDLKNYPENLDRDIELLNKYSKIEAVFVPDVKDIYPTKDTRVFDFGNLDKVMEGAYRKGHFNGVAQIVSKLFVLAKPHKVFFGLKDFQQLVIIKDLVQQMKMDIQIVACPIIRESDGLAMSSRNQLLSPQERQHAVMISKTLSEGKKKAFEMNLDKFKEWVIFTLNNDPFIEVEYFEIVDTIKLNPITNWEQPGEKIGCIAVRIGKIRLIDNLIFH